jgi:hypothetical protein
MRKIAGSRRGFAGENLLLAGLLAGKEDFDLISRWGR